MKTETIEAFLVRRTGGRVVIDVLYPLAVVPAGCPTCADEVEDMLFEVFGIWPSES